MQLKLFIPINFVWTFTEREEDMLNKLEANAKENRLHQATLLMKVKMQREKFDVIKDSDEFQRLIDAVGNLLIEIESQLQSQSGEMIQFSDIIFISVIFTC